jgi:hypothetical protein
MAKQDFLRRRQVLDFVAQHLHAPVERGLVDGGDHLGVDDVALLEGLVELELADHAAQRGLRQLRHSHDVVRRAVARAHRVGHLEVQDAVDLQLGVVARDADLARHVERDFLQAVLVGHPVDERDQEVGPGRHGAVVLAQALAHPGVLLRHELDRLADEDDRDDQDDEGDRKFHGALPCSEF